MRSILRVAVIMLGMCTTAAAEITVVGELDPRDGYDGLWALTVHEVPLAVCGVAGGTSVIDLADPATPVERGFLAYPTAPGRLLRSYLDLVYTVGSSGDLRILWLDDPQSPALVGSVPVGGARGLAIDASGARLHVSGTPRGLLVFDITSPAAPVELRAWDDLPLGRVTYDLGRVHAGGPHGAAVLDVTIGEPVLDTWIAYAGASIGDALLTADRSTLVTVDDVAGGSLRTFDVSRGGREALAIHPFDPAITPGRTSLHERIAITALGGAGLVVTDLTAEAAPITTASFTTENVDIRDVHLSELGVLALDATRGLLVLDVLPETGVVSGSVTTSGGGAATFVDVTAPALGRGTDTGNDGAYALTLPPGDHWLRFYRNLYDPDSVQVAISAGESITVDRVLTARPLGTVRGSISRESTRSAGTVRHPEGTIISFPGTDVSPVQVFDTQYFRPFTPQATYVIEANEFGFDPVQASVSVGAGQTRRDLTLRRAPLADDFSVDHGWSASAEDDAVTGRWERVDPEGTAAGFVQPDTDETPGTDTICWVTGNATPGGWIDVNDVDGGRTTLFSPTYDLSVIHRPILRYFRWFVNDAEWESERADGDAFRVLASTDEGATWTGLDWHTASSPTWEEVTFVLDRYLSVAGSLRLRFDVADIGAPSIVEAALDDVQLMGSDSLLVVPDPPEISGVDITSLDDGARIRWHSTLPDPLRAERDGTVLTTTALGDGWFQALDPAVPSEELVTYELVVAGDDARRFGPYRVVRGPTTPPPAAPSAMVAPNPFVDAVTVRAVAERDGVMAEIDVFDAAGRAVRRLREGPLATGAHRVLWDGRDDDGRRVSSGHYFFRIRVDGREVYGRTLRLAR